MSDRTVAASAFPFSLRPFLALDCGRRSPRAGRAQAIMQGVYQQDTSRDTSLRARLDVTAADGQTARKRFVLLRKAPSGAAARRSHASVIRRRFAAWPCSPSTRRAPPTAQWIYVPAQQRSRSVTPRERSERFVGGDFTYEDIGEHVLDDFSYRLLRAANTWTAVRPTRSQRLRCPPTARNTNIIYYWVAQDVPVIVNAEMYDAEGHEVRQLHASDLKQESGIWGARHIEMQTLADKTRTVLTIDEARFNTGLDDSPVYAGWDEQGTNGAEGRRQCRVKQLERFPLTRLPSFALTGVCHHKVKLVSPAAIPTAIYLLSLRRDRLRAGVGTWVNFCRVHRPLRNRGLSYFASGRGARGSRRIALHR